MFRTLPMLLLIQTRSPRILPVLTQSWVSFLTFIYLLLILMLLTVDCNFIFSKDDTICFLFYSLVDVLQFMGMITSQTAPLYISRTKQPSHPE